MNTKFFSFLFLSLIMAFIGLCTINQMADGLALETKVFNRSGNDINLELNASILTSKLKSYKYKINLISDNKKYKNKDKDISNNFNN